MSNPTQVDQHPSIINHTVLNELCTPLQKLGVHFFGYTSIDAQGQAYCLGSKLNYAKEYLRQNHAHNDVHYRPVELKKQYHYDFWDFLNLDARAEKLYRMAAEFDQGHTLTITRHDTDITHCYHFSGQLNDDGINQRYLEKLDSLHTFIDFFNDCLQNITEIAQIYQHPINVGSEKLNQSKPINLISADPRTINLADSAQNSIQFKYFSQYFLTDNERQCLRWLHQGKSAEMIAAINNVSRKTIERYIASIKRKLDCFTLFQMGEKTASNGISDFLRHIRRN
ncbi:helix-turn-helix transcriptional regulator [Legionella dresdenensis]|uniref:Helix-turn-helix transcriptional regulator n=1 Tax=Legionella dresdenensis TaxID=450200 RepID=A0ABV8CGV6_9GAMM